MAKVFVSQTMASCTGFLTEAVGSEEDVEAVRRAVVAYNEEQAWRDRGCDGTAYLHETADEAVAFWKDRCEDEGLSSWDDVVACLEADGEVSRNDARDFADFLLSLERQRENLFPAAL